MPSLINQMRNETPQQWQQPTQQMPQQLNNSIANVRNMMTSIKTAKDSQAALANMLQNNPYTSQIARMLQGNGNLESIAKEMARMYNIDINELIKQLQ